MHQPRTFWVNYKRMSHVVCITLLKAALVCTPPSFAGAFIFPFLFFVLLLKTWNPKNKNNESSKFVFLSPLFSFIFIALLVVGGGLWSLKHMCVSVNRSTAPCSAPTCSDSRGGPRVRRINSRRRGGGRLSFRWLAVEITQRLARIASKRTAKPPFNKNRKGPSHRQSLSLSKHMELCRCFISLLYNNNDYCRPFPLRHTVWKLSAVQSFLPFTLQTGNPIRKVVERLSKYSNPTKSTNGSNSLVNLLVHNRAVFLFFFWPDFI